MLHFIARITGDRPAVIFIERHLSPALRGDGKQFDSRPRMETRTSHASESYPNSPTISATAQTCIATPASIAGVTRSV